MPSCSIQEHRKLEKSHGTNERRKKLQHARQPNMRLTHSIMLHPAQNSSHLHLHLDGSHRQVCLETLLDSHLELHALHQIPPHLLQRVQRGLRHRSNATYCCQGLQHTLCYSHLGVHGLQHTLFYSHVRLYHRPFYSHTLLPRPAAHALLQPFGNALHALLQPFVPAAAAPMPYAVAKACSTHSSTTNWDCSTHSCTIFVPAAHPLLQSFGTVAHTLCSHLCLHGLQYTLCCNLLRLPHTPFYSHLCLQQPPPYEILSSLACNPHSVTAIWECTQTLLQLCNVANAWSTHPVTAIWDCITHFVTAICACTACSIPSATAIWDCSTHIHQPFLPAWPTAHTPRQPFGSASHISLQPSVTAWPAAHTS